jgi:DNA polymerase I-like protein with 3'-5' exonuclease and polymerase domains
MSVLVVSDVPLNQGYGLNILDSVFRALKVKYDIVSVLPAGSDPSKVKADRWLEEVHRVQMEARKHDKILCLGGLAASVVFDSAKSVPVTKVRGKGFIAPTGQFTICTYAPITVFRDPDFFRDFAFDISKLCENDSPLDTPSLEILKVESEDDLTLLDDLHGASFIACDIETTGFSSWRAIMPHVEPKILSIGFCALGDDGSGYAVVVPEEFIGKKVLEFLTTYKGITVFHNLKFDVQWLWHHYGVFDFHALADTMLMHWALDERPFNRYKSHGLDLLQRVHLDASGKSLSMGDWLYEFYRKDVGDDARQTWIKDFCESHPETARSCWRKWHIEMYGVEADWRGKKVGRDIEVETVAQAVMEQRMPPELQPAPDESRKAQMWDEMLTYMAEDCFATARLFPLFRDLMTEESERLWALHQNYLIPASLEIARMELLGSPVDVPYLQTMKVEIEDQLEKELEDIRKVVAQLTANPAPGEFNVNSPKQVEDLLYGEDTGLGLEMPRDVGRYAYKREKDKKTTNSDTLKALARIVAKENPAVSNLINAILNYRVKSKILGTYINGLLERVDGDNRIRGDFNLHGTATGRLSCSNPNLQNIPDASHVGIDIRRAYTCSPGWVNVEADQSQLELRVAALFSQDEVLLTAYRNNADIHQEVAKMLWNKPKDEITKYERYLAKCMNFGVLYGRGARSIATGPEMDNLVEMSGRRWGNKEIDDYFDKFKVGYHQLFEWMEVVKEDSVRKQYVEGPLGNRRRFDLILDNERARVERQSVNTPIQGFAAQMVVTSLASMSREFDPQKQRILFTVHDSIFIECLDDDQVILDTAEIIRHAMEEDLPKDVIVSFPTLSHSPFREGDVLEYNIPFVADIVVGANWAECKKSPAEYVASR